MSQPSHPPKKGPAKEKHGAGSGSSSAAGPKSGPNLLIILDGFGYREESTDNAINNATTPTWDTLWQNQPHTLISGSGEDVGLPAGQMGNSEVGHMNLGAGRVIYQDFTRINRAIEQKEFGNNRAFNSTFKRLQKNGLKAFGHTGLLYRIKQKVCVWR